MRQGKTRKDDRRGKRENEKTGKRFELPILRRIDKDDAESIADAFEDGFNCVGTLHSYELNIAVYKSNPIHVGRAPKHRHIIDGAVHVGLSALRHSRLYADARIPFEVAQKIYEERIRRAFDTSKVFVATRSNKGQVQVVGFCSLRENEIELIAVLQEYQGQQLGRRLFDKAIDACVEAGHRTIVVKTQGSNQQARGFYEKLGFERTKIEKDFHRYEDSTDRG